MPATTFPISHILPLTEQIHTLKRRFPKLKVEEALEMARRIKSDPKNRGKKFIAVVRSCALAKSLHICISVEAMHKRSKWKVFERPKPFTSPTDALQATFTRDPISKAYRGELAAQLPKGDIIILPAESVVALGASPLVLEEQCFAFDISSTAWFLMTHMRVFEQLNQDVRIAVLGEFCLQKQGPEVVCFEFVRGEFHIRIRTRAEVVDRGHVILVGKKATLL